MVKLFKKTLPLYGVLPSFKIERKNECSRVVSILGFLRFLLEKSGTRLAGVLKYYYRDNRGRIFYAG